jgi:catechol 2,3-dioxygenase-like lactoylglutathione lyase family enzyme
MLLDTLHFAFTVSDIDKSIAWYVEVLGLELVARQRSENAYIKQLVGMSDAVLEVAQFKIKGASPGLSTHMLELIQYVTPVGGNSFLPTNATGTAHLGFLTDDINHDYQRLVRLGVEFTNPPVTISEGVNAGGAACYFRDPDGITLELLMPSPERLASFTSTNEAPRSAADPSRA